MREPVPGRRLPPRIDEGQGCELLEDGAHRAASRIVTRSASSIGSPVKAGGDERSRKIGSIGRSGWRLLLVGISHVSYPPSRRHLCRCEGLAFNPDLDSEPITP